MISTNTRGSSRPDSDGGSEIVTSKGDRILIDAADRVLVEHLSWCRHGTGFIARDKGRSGKLVLLHRVITGALPGQFVDHISGDLLDNRRANLRICTVAQNNRNRRKHSGRQAFKGVSLTNGKFRAAITVAGKYRHLGVFTSAAAAAQAYDAAAREYHGEFACLNFPVGEEQPASRPDWNCRTFSHAWEIARG